MANTMRHALSNVAANSRRANSPLPLLIVGLALILFWVLASVLQIQTSEAFLLRGPAVTFVPNWGVLKQPLDLVQGHLTTDMAKATMWGWGIELIYLVCIVGYEVAHESVKASNHHLAAWFRTGAVASSPLTLIPISSTAVSPAASGDRWRSQASPRSLSRSSG